MNKVQILIFQIFAYCVLAIVGANAHPSGVSKVDVTIHPDKLEIRVDVNHDDLFYALRFKETKKSTKTEISEMADRVAYYFQTRVYLKFDGLDAAGMKIISWRKSGPYFVQKLDSSSFEDTTIALILAWPIPAGTKRFELSSKLFAELEVQPLSHIRIFYRDQEIKRKFLGLDDRVFQSLEKDTLDQMLEKVLHPVAANDGSNGAFNNSSDNSPNDYESIIGRFIKLGFTHILPEGMDHILFVLGLFFFSTLLRPLLWQVTAFTLAHSITLGLSLFGIFSLPSRIVEPVIALSIVIVALENIFFRKLRPSRFLIVFGFGLIHGLGFASVLKGLGLPEGQFFKVLVSFNVGVELGQLTVIAAASALTVWMWNKPWYFKRVVIPASVLIAGIGFFWFVQRMLALS